MTSGERRYDGGKYNRKLRGNIQYRAFGGSQMDYLLPTETPEINPATTTGCG
ncbi:MAG: hypothetical protein IPJ30_05300 [Acidobacteria bacterium]|nr:hypothetical protein [Acidobacteriota bacterium]